MTLAERLLAGEHHGCATWSDVAKKLKCDERHLRVVRKTLAGKGQPVGLVPELGSDKPDLGTEYRKTDTVIGSSIKTREVPDSTKDAAHKTKPTVQVCAGGKWPSVEAFDREIPVDPVPSGHVIKGVSTLLDPDGNIKQQWLKTTTAEHDDRAVLIEAIRNIANEWPAVPEMTAPPQHSDDDLLCVYPMGDPHIGMLAWAPETGENFDLSIAERNLVAAVDHLALLAPPAKRALVATVGDTFHSDGLSNSTTAGTRVDVDGRTSKMIDVGVRTFRRVIHRALLRHQEVEVKIAPGNHDALLSIMLRVALSQFFENEPRVHIDQSPEDFLWYRFGANLLGINHGHRAKPDVLMQVMAVDCAEDWGQTRHRRIYRGHYHHDVTKEVPGVTVDTLNTLASTDDWHRRSGYRSTRHMRMDIIHREFGLINRHIVGIEQLRLREAA